MSNITAAILTFAITISLTALIEFLFARHVKKAEEKGRVNETDDKFVVRYSKMSFYGGLVMLLVAAVFIAWGITAISISMYSGDMGPIDILISSMIFAILFIIGGVMYVLWYLNRKIIIDGDTITSVSMSKKTTVMKFSDIIGRKPIGYVTRSGYMIKTDQYMANLDKFRKKLEEHVPHVVGK